MRPANKERKIRYRITVNARSSVLLFCIIFLAAFPSAALTAQVVGGEVQVQEPEVNVQNAQDMQQAQDLDQPDMGAMDVAGDADLTLRVPVQIENLHFNVDRGQLSCAIRRWIGQGENMSGVITETREFEIEDGAYNNIFTFYFSVPPDLDPEYSHGYYCRVFLKDTESGDDFVHVWDTNTNQDILEGHPNWAIVGEESNLASTGGIDW